MTVRVAVRLPTALGEKVIAILQLEAAAKVPAQLLLVAKSAAFVPPMAMLAIVNVPEPEFVSVTVFDALVVPTFWLPNASVEGVTVALATPPPVPVSETVWVEAVLPALSLILSVPVRVPAAVGVKVTAMVQLPPIATLPAQVLVAE